MLALVLQALLPAAAMAAAPDTSQRIAICTAAGLKMVEVGGKAPGETKGFAGFACLDCVFTALATTQPPELDLVAVRYAVIAPLRPTVSVFEGLGSRPPPRPPGQGPPNALNA